MVTSMKENGRMVKFMVKEHLFGMMVQGILVIGLMVIWMVKVQRSGLMVPSTKENLKKIK